MHWRGFRKDRPIPAWLKPHVPVPQLTGVQSVDHRLRYYSRLWQAQPMWADLHQVRAIYAEAHRRRRAGEDVVVDHIIPLRGALVSGLHTHSNLHIVPRLVNAALSNRVYPGCPQRDLFEETHAGPYFELELQYA